MSILGVNQAGYERDNPLIVDGRSLPWLQELSSDDAWGDWGVEYRDVVILDSTNVIVDVLNLTDNNLQDEANRNVLKQKLRNAGEQSAPSRRD